MGKKSEMFEFVWELLLLSNVVGRPGLDEWVDIGLAELVFGKTRGVCFSISLYLQ